METTAVLQTRAGNNSDQCSHSGAGEKRKRYEAEYIGLGD